MLQQHLIEKKVWIDRVTSNWNGAPTPLVTWILFIILIWRLLATTRLKKNTILMEGKGKALLDVFIRAGCSEAISDGLNGDDLGKLSQL